jgi:hypothetical protein
MWNDAEANGHRITDVGIRVGKQNKDSAEGTCQSSISDHVQLVIRCACDKKE